MAYLVVAAAIAIAHLHAAHDHIGALRKDLTTASVTSEQLQRDTARVQHDADTSVTATSGPFWALAGHVPFAGRSTRSLHGAATLVRSLSRTALPQTVTIERQLAQTEGRGRVTLAPLVAAQQPIAQLASLMTASATRADVLPRSSGIYPVEDVRQQLAHQLHDLADQLTVAAQVARIAPDMFGAAGPRTYFVSFENEAESRGLGGLPGAFAIVKADQGALSFVHYGTDGELEGYHSGVELPADYAEEYPVAGANPGNSYINSDISPDFPTAARIWIGMWKAKTGQTLDGAIVLDPTALAALLKLTGPAKLPDGTLVSSADVVQLTERDVYATYSQDNSARKQFLLAVAKAASDLVVRQAVHAPQAAASVIARQAGERRLLLYSAHPDEQAVLAAQPISGQLAPASGPGAVDGPYLMVDVVNAAGNKTDYYLHRTIDWTAGSCSGPTRPSTVTVTLHNAAPPGLSDYAGGRRDSGAGDGTPIGTDRLLVEVRPTVGAGLAGATLDGAAVGVAPHSERGRPVFVADVVLLPGQTRTLVLHLVESTAARGPATVVDQPLVIDPQVHADVPAC